jgi:hypothetical protein
VAGVSDRHSNLPPELRQLAQVVLDRLDPAVRAAAAAAAGDGNSAGKCQQVWCPVCALAALVQGEQHPMLEVIAEHSVALLTVVRAIVDTNGAPPPDGDGPGDGAPPPASRYEHIPISVEEPEI